MRYGYIRVSTKEQNEERQIKFMEEHGIHPRMIFVDKATGKNFDRPQYQEMKSLLQEGDSILVISVDRLGRNKEQSLYELGDLKRKGVIFQAGDIPTSMADINEENKPIMEMVNNILIEVMTTMASEELKKIRTRQRQGIDAMPICEDTGKRKSKKKDKSYIGRPNKIKNLSPEHQRQINSWIKKTIKLSDCIKNTGLSESTLYRIKREMKSNGV